MSLGLLPLQGVLQGGGFGLGYGFGVRLGYDGYGALKDTLFGSEKSTKEAATSARYSANPLLSQVGTGLLTALKLQ